VTHDSAVAARAPRLLRLHEGHIVDDVLQDGGVRRSPDGRVVAAVGADELPDREWPDDQAGQAAGVTAR